MPKGYCVKCGRQDKTKGMVEIQDPQKTTTSKGKAMLKGKCPNCGTTVCTFKVD